MTTKNLRITIIGLHYSPETTGNAPYTSSLAEGLAAVGHEVRVITGVPHYPEWKVHHGYRVWYRHDDVNGVQVQRLRHFVPSRPSAAHRMHMELSFGLRCIAVSWGRPDVVLVVSPALLSSALAVFRARLTLGRPSIGIWVQDIYSRGLLETGKRGRLTTALASLAARFEACVLSSADKTVAIHDRFKQHLVDNLRLHPDDVTVIRNWTHLPASPVADRSTTRLKLGWREDEVVILHAGNMGKKQGLENVINAAKSAQEDDTKLRFVLMGNGNQRPYLMRQGRGIKNLDFVDSLPEDEYRSAMEAADILLVNELPGVKDMSVPSKLTSYFSTGRPVIAATDAGSVTAGELEVSRGGLRVSANDPNALIEAAKILAADPELASSLGANGLTFQRETLSARAAIADYDDFVSSLAKPRGR